jgi:hypothetical protein
VLDDPVLDDQALDDQVLERSARSSASLPSSGP